MTAYVRPRDLAEAVATRAAHPDWMVLAGGTDLMVNAPRKDVPAGILDLWRLPGLGGIARAGATITIGAGTTYREIADHAVVRELLSPLALAAREVGALQIQARATIGGNIGTSSPVGDGLPPLLALDAELELASPRGSRRVAVSRLLHRLPHHGARRRRADRRGPRCRSPRPASACAGARSARAAPSRSPR